MGLCYKDKLETKKPFFVKLFLSGFAQLDFTK